MNSLLSISMQKVRKGVIYTLYTATNVKRKEEGDEIDTEEVPKYQEDAMVLTDAVIKIEKQDKRGKDGSSARSYTALIDSSKIKSIKSGTKFDITDKKLCEVLKW